jgi:hypothetical protein
MYCERRVKGLLVNILDPLKPRSAAIRADLARLPYLTHRIAGHAIERTPFSRRQTSCRKLVDTGAGTIRRFEKSIK